MIEKQTINGRSASIAYLDDSLQPATKEDYSYARVLFDDDGGNSSLLMKRPPQPGKFNPVKWGQANANAWNAHREKHRREYVAPPPAVLPIDTKLQAQRVAQWSTAIAIVDESEMVMRDLIERDLANIAAVPGTTYGDAKKAVDQLMKKITRLRVTAIKKAFRLLRDTAP